MRQGAFIVISGLLLAALAGCDDSNDRRSRYAEKKHAPRTLDLNIAPHRQE